ncbi:MAG TPA: hypothetical protein PLZ00_04190 [Mangrovimonas sp.]|nr:hypothetical protein [Mangrovimonas sp.]
MIRKIFPPLLVVALLLVSCNNDDDSISNVPLNPDTAARASVDRFSPEAGTLMVRTASNGLPAANMPINFDSGEPFITQGFAPDGSVVQYYNFDVQSTVPAPIYLFFDSEDNAVEGQLNIVGVKPGDAGYNDFWEVNRVIVPDNYVPNTITSETELLSSGMTIVETTTIVNCPIVPEGSMATKRLGSEDDELHRGWYKDQVIFYFSFFEKILDGGASEMVPTSPIFVSFNVNPDDANPNSGPASGFMTEMGTTQTHNVIATVPANAAYSPLWWVSVYDNADFDMVSNLTSASSSNILASGVATVNCPVVTME